MPVKLKPIAIEGALNAAGLSFGIVVSRFNSFITDRLLAGALDALSRAGAGESQIELVRVPGSFEVPVAAKKLAESRRLDAIICIGCVLRGETSHYELVASEVARGVQLAQMDTGVPMMFCVLACDTLEQAIDRAGLKAATKDSSRDSPRSKWRVFRATCAPARPRRSTSHRSPPRRNR